MGRRAERRRPDQDPITAPELQRETEQFYDVEAPLLDFPQYREWVYLLADDVRYRMPLRFNRNQREKQEHCPFQQPQHVLLNLRE